MLSFEPVTGPGSSNMDSGSARKLPAGGRIALEGDRELFEINPEDVVKKAARSSGDSRSSARSSGSVTSSVASSSTSGSGSHGPT